MSTQSEPAAIGIIGGSGLYDFAGMRNVREVRLSTPFGEPSDTILEGVLGDKRVLFLPRHGRGHRFLPSEVPSRANIHALKQLGAQWLVSVSAVGSLREEIRPGDLVMVDQLIDRTHRRATTFFGEGCAGHVGFADPVCQPLVQHLIRTAQAEGYGLGAGVGKRVHAGGTYVCMEGPQFSTRAESDLHRAWGADVIGMTAAPEMKLAREAELCCAVMALATDYDCWKAEEASVTVEAVVAVLTANVAGARGVVEHALAGWPGRDRCGCAVAAEHAIMTAPASIPVATKERLSLLYGRFWS